MVAEKVHMRKLNEDLKAKNQKLIVRATVLCKHIKVNNCLNVFLEVICIKINSCIILFSFRQPIRKPKQCYRNSKR